MGLSKRPGGNHVSKLSENPAEAPGRGLLLQSLPAWAQTPRKKEECRMLGEAPRQFAPCNFLSRDGSPPISTFPFSKGPAGLSPAAWQDERAPFPPGSAPTETMAHTSQGAPAPPGSKRGENSTIYPTDSNVVWNSPPPSISLHPCSNSTRSSPEGHGPSEDHWTLKEASGSAALVKGVFGNQQDEPRTPVEWR